MALQLIYGNSGSGKSTYIYEKVIQMAQADRRRNFLCHCSGAVYNADTEGAGAPIQKSCNRKPLMWSVLNVWHMYF